MGIAPVVWSRVCDARGVLGALRVCKHHMDPSRSYQLESGNDIELRFRRTGSPLERYISCEKFMARSECNGSQGQQDPGDRGGSLAYRSGYSYQNSLLCVSCDHLLECRVSLIQCFRHGSPAVKPSDPPPAAGDGGDKGNGEGAEKMLRSLLGL